MSVLVRPAVPGLFDTARLGYAQVLVAGDLVFVAGQAGLDERFEVVSGEFADQARLAFSNLGHALHAADCTYASVVALTVYLTDIGQMQTYADIRREVMGEAVPTSTLVEVSALALPGLTSRHPAPPTPAPRRGAANDAARRNHGAGRADHGGGRGGRPRAARSPGSPTPASRRSGPLISSVQSILCSPADISRFRLERGARKCPNHRPGHGGPRRARRFPSPAE